MPDESWFYNSGPPQRYTTNYKGYLAGGGLVRPVEDMGRFSPGEKGSGDSARFWFFCLVSDQLQKEGLLGDIAEVGVYKGHTAALLTTIARRLGKTAFLFDTFEGFHTEDLVGIDAGKQAGQFSDTSLEAVRHLVGEESTRFIKGYFPDSTKDIPDNLPFCLVHIDCDLYSPIVSALEYFYPRMVPGGFIVIHDYSSLGWNGAEKAVDNFFADKEESVTPLFDSAGSAIVRRAKPPGNAHNWQLLQTQRLLARGWVEAGRNALAFMLGAGWSGPEPWGVWGVGSRHEIRIQLPAAADTNLRIDADVHAHLPGSNAQQEIKISVRDRVLAHWTFTAENNRGVRSIVIPAAVGAGNGGPAAVELQFELRYQHPNIGGRPIGMALHRIRIEEQPGA